MHRPRGVLARWLAPLMVVMFAINVWSSPAGSLGLPHQELFVNGRATTCVSVASTKAAQEEGLRGAPAETAPMAFVFARPGRYGFWMAGVSHPITVGWVVAHRLIGAVAMAPESSAVYLPPVSIRLAMEFIAGRGLPPIGSRISLGPPCRR